VLFDGKVVIADNDVVIVITENVQILHINFTAPSSRPVHWRRKSILVKKQVYFVRK